MYKKSFGLILFLLILLIAIFHNIAMVYYIYWRYLWTDLVVHFLSGFWIALVGFWIFRFWTKEPFRFSVVKTFAVTIGLAVVVGIAWEVFEYAVGIVEYSSRYTNDTILDVLMDVLGGGTGFFAALLYEKYLDKSMHQNDHSSALQ